MPQFARRARREATWATRGNRDAREPLLERGEGDRKLTRPAVWDYGRARGLVAVSSGLAPPQLGVAPLGFVLGRVALRHGTRLAPRRRWRGLRARRPLRSTRLDRRATLRLAALASRRAHVRAHPLSGPIEAIGSVGAIGPIGLPAVPIVAAGLGRTLTLVARPTRNVRTPARGGNDADAAQVAPAYAHLAPAIVIHGPLRHPRDECVRAAAVLEDEARLGPVRPREHHARAAVIAVGVVVGIVEHDDAEAHARVVVNRPQRIAHICVAIVAQEPRVVVVAVGVKKSGVGVPIAGVRRAAPPRPPRE